MFEKSSNLFPHVSANLPADLITDIFSRLPVKSLSRFKSVSKSMYALIHNPIFVKKHLSRAMQTDPNLILRNEFKLFFVSVGKESISKAHRIQLPFAILSLDNVEISGSCNGLVCISDQQCNEDIFLYNPSTKLYNKLPVPKFDVPTIGTSCFTSLGFGYHQAEDDYKVIRSVYLYDKPFVNIDSYECEARVYSLKSDEWKKIGAIPFHISSRAAVPFRDEFLIWKASRGLGRGMSVLVVAFDMNKDEFVEIQQPEVRDKMNQFQIEVGVVNGEFSLFHMWRSERVEIWTMKEFGVKDSWRKLLVIGKELILDEFFVHLKPVCLMKNINGKILIEKSEGELILYDFQNEIAEDFNIKGAPRWFSVYTCVGSLVSPFSSSPDLLKLQDNEDQNHKEIDMNDVRVHE
ncbi:F-box protein [Melia azedarach]|uniref:F-box protein n=1 Tax=Melia azedarach TaxID=155640 RepID=A0ACC1X1G1_MELAZ|nr:F-box protein [Melia azedarach]